MGVDGTPEEVDPRSLPLPPGAKGLPLVGDTVEFLRDPNGFRSKRLERYGPVRAVVPEVVLEVAFDAVQRSTRHKSGIAMRFPRIKRIRWDKPAGEADHVATIAALIEGEARSGRKG